MNYYDKAVQLLEEVANSVFERDPKNPNPFFFRVEEVKLVEKWLLDFDKERRYFVEVPTENKEL